MPTVEPVRPALDDRKKKQGDDTNTSRVRRQSTVCNCGAKQIALSKEGLGRCRASSWASMKWWN
jgi:hypothetical protein